MKVIYAGAGLRLIITEDHEIGLLYRVAGKTLKASEVIRTYEPGAKPEIYLMPVEAS